MVHGEVVGLMNRRARDGWYTWRRL